MPRFRPLRALPGVLAVIGVFAVLAALLAAGAGLAIAAQAGARQRTVTTTSLLEVAFASPSRGVGLFETARYAQGGNGPGHCRIYTRPTSDGGRTFGTEGGTIAGFNCANGVPASSVWLQSPRLLLVQGRGLEVSHDLGRTWRRAALPGTIVNLAISGRSVWALVTTCATTARHCRLTLFHSTDGALHWHRLNDQPPDRTVDGAVADSGEGGRSALMASTPSGGIVLALPAPSRGADMRMPPTATVEQLPPPTATSPGATDRTGGWRSLTVPCESGGFGSQLSIAADGSQWLACSSEPGAGEQLKGVDISTDGGSHWHVAAPPCTGTCRHERMPLNGYLFGLSALSSRSAFYIGARSSLAGTFDGGRSWHVWPRIGNDAGGTFQVTFANDRIGWVLADDLTAGGYDLWRTRDGGHSWKRIWTG